MENHVKYAWRMRWMRLKHIRWSIKGPVKRTIHFSKKRKGADRELSLGSLFRRILLENLLLTSDERTGEEKFSGQLRGETTESNAISPCRLLEQRRGLSLSFLFLLMFPPAKIALPDYVISQPLCWQCIVVNRLATDFGLTSATPRNASPREHAMADREKSDEV